MRLEEGKTQIQSKMGATCTILLFFVLIAFTGYKVSVLEGKKAVDIQTSVYEDFYDNSHVFGIKQGLNFAVGIYNKKVKSTAQTLDPSIGRFQIEKRTYSLDESGKGKLVKEKLGYHVCSERELGLSEEKDSKFWPVYGL